MLFVIPILLITSLAGASLKYLNEEKKVESSNLKSIDPRDEFLKSFEDELGLTQAPFMISMNNDDNNKHGLDTILAMDESVRVSKYFQNLLFTVFCILIHSVEK